MRRLFKTTLILSVLWGGVVHAHTLCGSYIGGMIGYESLHASINATGAGLLDGVSLRGDAGARGRNLGLLFGYGRTFDNRYVGIEAEVVRGNARAALTITADDSTTLSAEHKYNYGLYARAGWFVVPNTLAYVRLGEVALKGLRVGLGTEIVLNQHISTRLDWVYTDYSALSRSNALSDFSADLDSSTIRLQGIYRF